MKNSLGALVYREGLKIFAKWEVMRGKTCGSYFLVVLQLGFSPL